jgi:hypothetical protein
MDRAAKSWQLAGSHEPQLRMIVVVLDSDRTKVAALATVVRKRLVDDH